MAETSTNREPVHYEVTETRREQPDMPACPNCGSAIRRCLDLRLGRIPVRAFAALCEQYAQDWPESVVEQVPDGYRIIGSHVCCCGAPSPGEGTE